MATTFHVGSDGSESRLRLVGELDLGGVDVLLSAVEQAAASGGDLVLDLRDLTFLDSSGIGAFVRIARERGDGRTLVLDAPRPEVRRVLDLVGLSAAPNLEIRTP
jgi:anti-sigma B factor antagonist